MLSVSGLITVTVDHGEFDRLLSSMMLHHLDGDAKTAAAAEIFASCTPAGDSIWSTWVAT
jgi:hypothetical protein